MRSQCNLSSKEFAEHCGRAPGVACSGLGKSVAGGEVFAGDLAEPGLPVEAMQAACQADEVARPDAVRQVAGAARSGADRLKANLAGTVVHVDENDAFRRRNVGNQFDGKLGKRRDVPRTVAEGLNDACGDSVVPAALVRDGVDTGQISPRRSSSPFNLLRLTQRRMRPSSTMAGAAEQWPMHSRLALMRTSLPCT